MAPQSRGLKSKPAARKDSTTSNRPSIIPAVQPLQTLPPLISPSPASILPSPPTYDAASSNSFSAPPTATLGSTDIHVDGDEPEDDEDEDEDADFQSHYSLAASSASGSSSSSSEDGSASDNETSGSQAAGAPSDGRGRDGSSQRGNGVNGHHRNSQGSATNLTFSRTFAPPFYNRPPTPLPPSPSLTSLLRPPFSTTTSRPTTPDSSEVETPPDTEATVAKSARTATTVPRASPKVPTYEYYGFGVYLASTGAFIIYLLWSYLPSPFLHQFGIYYYPNRWWSLAIPSFLVMLIIYIYVALASYNTGYLTLPMDSIENLVDDAANIAFVDEDGFVRNRNLASGEGTIDTFDKHWRDGWQDAWHTGTDAVMDVPIGAVCEILYGDLAEDERSKDRSID